MPAFDAIALRRARLRRLALARARSCSAAPTTRVELGAYHDLWEPRRLADLRAQLRDYAPVGIDIDIRLAT